jgi:hypothetical protein
LSVRSSLLTLGLAALAAAPGAGCGKDEPAPPKPEPKAAVAPVFAGVQDVRNSPGSDDTLVIEWKTATDDYTPPSELRYDFQVWENDPRGGGSAAPIDHQDVTDLAKGTCNPCAYRYVPPPGSAVWWFAITVTDRDSVYGPGGTGAAGAGGGAGSGAGGSGGAGAAVDHVAGADVVLPGARRTSAPAFGDPWSDHLSVRPGDLVSLLGAPFLDEPAFDDALTIAGKPVPLANIREWGDLVVKFEVPADAATGAVTLRTIFGTTTSPSPLQINP